MSNGIKVLHSHSGMEGALGMPKHIVLVDEEFGDLFTLKTPIKHNGVIYYKVSTLEFANKGGVFKKLYK